MYAATLYSYNVYWSVYLAGFSHCSVQSSRQLHLSLQHIPATFISNNCQIDVLAETNQLYLPVNVDLLSELRFPFSKYGHSAVMLAMEPVYPTHPPLHNCVMSYLAYYNKMSHDSPSGHIIIPTTYDIMWTSMIHMHMSPAIQATITHLARVDVICGQTCATSLIIIYPSLALREYLTFTVQTNLPHYYSRTITFAN
jgi:hypothetical protein